MAKVVNDEPRVASMEPRSFDRGGDESWCDVELGYLASMEPRSFDRGGHSGRFASAALITALQWSRGLSTAEGKAAKAEALLRLLASMEPRSFDRGGSTS